MILLFVGLYPADVFQRTPIGAGVSTIGFSLLEIQGLIIKALFQPGRALHKLLVVYLIETAFGYSQFQHIVLSALSVFGHYRSAPWAFYPCSAAAALIAFEQGRAVGTVPSLYLQVIPAHFILFIIITIHFFILSKKRFYTIVFITLTAMP
jgi:hypothetical protein